MDAQEQFGHGRSQTLGSEGGGGNGEEARGDVESNVEEARGDEDARRHKAGDDEYTWEWGSTSTDYSCLCGARIDPNLTCICGEASPEPDAR